MRRPKPKISKPISFTQRPAPKVDHSTEMDDVAWIESGTWMSVTSSDVAAIKYDEEEEELYVSFRSGNTGRYRGVPAKVAADMFNCTSMGTFVHRYLIDRYLWVVD